MSFELSLVCWKADVPEVIKKTDPATQEEVNVFSGKTIQEDYPIRENLQAMLRAPGVFKEVNDVAEAVHLAHVIKDETEETVTVDRQQVVICLIGRNYRICQMKKELQGRLPEYIMMC